MSGIVCDSSGDRTAGDKRPAPDPARRPGGLQHHLLTFPSSVPLAPAGQAGRAPITVSLSVPSAVPLRDRPPPGRNEYGILRDFWPVVIQ
jgi:hypothetical protein